MSYAEQSAQPVWNLTHLLYMKREPILQSFVNFGRVQCDIHFCMKGSGHSCIVFFSCWCTPYFENYLVSLVPKTSYLFSFTVQCQIKM